MFLMCTTFLTYGNGHNHCNDIDQDQVKRKKIIQNQHSQNKTQMTYETILD